MGIGGIGSAYGVGSIYPSYVYNPNTVSAKSMDKLSKISDDVLDKKVDYSEMAAEENQNPLKKGQTIDFEGIVARQMQQGQNRAAKLMPKGLMPEEENADAKVVQMPERGEAPAGVAKAAPKEEAAADANAGNENGAASMQNPSMMMAKAIQAYEMFMTA
ncbi:MAG: hypothetical protein NC341_03850 [Blautia sp.]|nr:hypothetical protein [Blautia sp.]MCM1200731.1 hypothetical protein [Bacteroides fragilis]